jgi:hypothetical protein
MADQSINSLKVQGKRGVCIYNYKATMNDEVTLNDSSLKFNLKTIILTSMNLKT